MPRALFEKTGDAIFMSHLDLMRLFQRAFKRAGLPLTHTQGYNPRPSVSIALPLSVGVQSRCELLDFDLEGSDVSCDEICDRLNRALVQGVRVINVYNDGRKIRDLALLNCTVTLEYDNGIPKDACDQIEKLFSSDQLIVEKKGKNGVVEQDVIPMIRKLFVTRSDENACVINALICCQNPTLNPALLVVAIERYLPEIKPDFACICRVEIFDGNETIFR
jgi:radical SAM-linked protein